MKVVMLEKLRRKRRAMLKGSSWSQYWLTEKSWTLMRMGEKG